MPITLAALPPRAGVFLYELTAGPTPPAIALYRRTYVIAKATLGDLMVPTPIGSTDDFANTFGTASALVLNSVEAYLRNNRQGLYVVRAEAYPMATVTVTNASDGVKSLTVAGQAISFTAASSTMQAIITALVTAINNNTNINATVEAEYEVNDAGDNVYTNNRFYIRSKNGSVFTLSAGTGVTISNVEAPTSLKYWDYLRVLDDLIATQEEEELGFLCIPEAFYSLTLQYERTQVAQAMEATARELGWYALLDPGPPNTVNTPVKAVTESDNYTAVRGHSAYYFPWLEDSDNDDISPAMLLGAIALKRYEVEGIHKPPAGTRYPLAGVSAAKYKLSKTDLDLLATNKINPIVYKRGIGFCFFDTYTRATDTNFRFVSTRVIMSCLERSILDTVNASGILFDAIGARGIFFIRLRNIIEGVVKRFYDGDALYGATADQAYKVLCDATMQNDADLEAGIVYAEVYAVPAGTARQIRLAVFRVAIGQLATALTTAA